MDVVGWFAGQILYVCCGGGGVCVCVTVMVAVLMLEYCHCSFWVVKDGVGKNCEVEKTGAGAKAKLCQASAK